MNGGHYCRARSCDTRVPPHMLMCDKHWGMVPIAIRRAIAEHYRPGQTDKDASAPYVAAAGAAVASVSDFEDRIRSR